MNWYHEKEGISQGPHSAAEMATLTHEGSVTPETLIWQPAMDEWQPLAAVKPAWAEPAKPTATTTAKPAPRPSTKPLAPSQKDDAPKKSWWKKMLGQ